MPSGSRLDEIKSRYRQSQIKSHLQVNAAVLEFNWYLGHDISEIMRTRIWGSGVINQVSLDLKAVFPEAQGFSTDNLYRMARFYRFYSEQNEIVAQVVQQLQPAENKQDIFVGIAREDLQGAERAEYGKQVVSNLSERLTKRFGAGFDFSSIYQYIKFYRTFPQIVDAVRPELRREFGILDSARPESSADIQIVNATRQQLLPWTHYRELIRVENAEARLWYEQESRREGWSSRVLHRNIGSQYYFRLLQSQVKQPVIDEMHSLTAPLQDNLEYIKNPVVVEFLGFRSDDSYTEKTLEGRLALHMQKFIMELGKGFAFIGRQQHVHTDIDDYYIDLVFYNYMLKCFFLIDLKTHQITHQDVGQMDMYVRMYDQMKRSEGDNPTIGIILCSETSEDMALYSVLNGNNRLFQAKYLTYLPAKDELTEQRAESQAAA